MRCWFENQLFVGVVYIWRYIAGGFTNACFMATAAAAGASTSAARSEAKASSDATSTSGGDNVGDSSIVRTQFTSSEYFIAFTLYVQRTFDQPRWVTRNLCFGVHRSIYRSTKAARAHASAKDKGKGKRKSNGGAGDESLALSSATSSSRGKVQATAAMAEGAIGFGLAALFGDAGAGEMGFELLSFDASSSSGIIGIDAK